MPSRKRERELLEAMLPLAILLVTLPLTPITLLADRAYGSDWLREFLEFQDFLLIAAHRKGRVKESKNDGRTLLKLKPRWKVERKISWLHSFRRVVTRFEKTIDHFEGFVNLGCAFLALGKLVME